MGTALAWQGTALAQSPVPPSPTPPATAAKELAGASEIGGRTTIDLIRLDGTSPAVPLRNAGLIPGSESVDLDGRPLKKGVDYAIDYGSGTIYVMRPVRPGMALRAAYRFDKTRAQTQTGPNGSQFTPNGFRLDFRGGNTLTLGLGMAERRDDGAVISSNVYGYRSNFTGGGGLRMQGMSVISDQKRVQTTSLLENGKAEKPVEEGQDRALIQSLGMNLMGGSLQADVQDIGRKFTGFSAFRNAGYEDAKVNQFQKERGLRRLGFRLNDVGGPGLKLTTGLRAVRDGDQAIEWRNYGIKTNGVTLQYDSTHVDSGFKRFNDLAEGDREQLKREAGLRNERLTSQFDFRGAKGGYQQLRVADDAGNGFQRRKFDLGVGAAKVQFGDQRVEAGFTRFTGLREADAGQLARERGMRRQNFGLEYKIPGVATPWVVRNEWVRTDTTDGAALKSSEVALGGKNWGFERVVRGLDSGLTILGNLPEPEIQSHVSAITRMYEPGGFAFQPQDRNGFFQGLGLERTAERLNLNFGRGAKFLADRMELNGQHDKGEIYRLGLDTKNIDATFRRQSFGNQLTEVSTLMEFERARVGNLAGLDKTDASLNVILGAKRNLSLSMMSAERVGEGEASRQSLAYSDTSLQIQYANRRVDDGFSSVGSLVDPERETMGALRGFRQQDFALRWAPMRGLVADLNWRQDNGLKLNDQDRKWQQTILSYAPDAKTKLDYYRLETSADNPNELLFMNRVERFAFSRDLGRMAKIGYSRESVDYDGRWTTSPDSDRSTVSMSAQLSRTTALKTEHTETTYSDGNRDVTREQTVSTQLSPRTGVAISMVSVDRSGERPDEEKRNYGVWFDFGRGIRLNYGVAREVNSTADGTGKRDLTMTPGQVGGLAIGSMAYSEQLWDRQRFLNTGNVQLSSVKPFQLGPLRDFTFRFGADTVRDRLRYQRENRNIAVATKLFGLGLGFEYFSQIAPTGERAIDRTFNFTTPKPETSKYSAAVFYKLRTLPGDRQVMIRNYSFTARLAKDWTVTNQMQTNPEVARGDLILGSLPQAHRVNKWRMDFNGSASTKIGLTWEELMNDEARTRSRVGGVNLTLFANNASPLVLFYGLEQGDQAKNRRTVHRYNLRFDQRPGPNQLLSLFAGNISYQHNRDTKLPIQNWSLRAEYQLRF